MTETQLHENTPYNTNLHDGLPPGPIDSPDVAAIEAVLHPAPKTPTTEKLDLLRHHQQGRPDQVHRQLQPVQDLEQRGQEERDLIIAGQHAAVLGSPIGHSLSPVLHRAAYRALGLHDWDYEAIECDEAGLPGLLDSLGPGWAGLSLTMPLKRAVLPLLDQAETLAAEVGGANTVVFADGGRLGFNTDVPGMITALAEAGITTAGAALVLGAGATACAALGALRGLGVAEVAVAVRNPATAGLLQDVAGRLGINVRLVPFNAGVCRSLPGPC